MGAHQPVFGMPAYRVRHARPRSRWRSAGVLLPAAAVVGVADTPGGSVMIGAAVVVAAVIALLRRRWVRAAAQLEEMLESELSAWESPSAVPPQE
jgi:hypothetical protein